MSSDHPSEPSPATPSAPPHRFSATRKILVPTDLSPRAEAAVGYALELAASTGAEVLLLHVVEPLATYPVAYKGLFAEARAWEEHGAAASEALRQLAGQQSAPVRCIQREGNPFKEILEAATGEAVDLIVMTTHGRTGLTHLLIGSVAERVVRQAPCPVLVLPTGDAPAADSP